MKKILAKQVKLLENIEKKLELDAILQKSQFLVAAKQDAEIAVDDKSRHRDLIELKNISRMMFDELKLHSEIFRKNFGDPGRGGEGPTTEEKNEQVKREEEQTAVLKEISKKIGLSFKEGKEGTTQSGGLASFLGIGLGIGVGALVGQFNLMMDTLKVLTKLVPKGLKASLLNGMNTIVKFVSSVGEAASKITKNAVASVVLAAAEKFSTIMPKLAKAFEWLSTKFSPLTDFVVFVFNKGKAAIEVIRDSFALLTKVSSPIGSAVSSVSSFGGKILSFFQNMAGKLGAFTSVFGAVTKIISKIAYPLTIVMAIWDTVKGTISGFEEGGFVGAISGAIKGLFNGLVFGFMDTIKGMVSWVLDAIGLDAVSNLLDSFSFEDMFSGLVDAVFLLPKKLGEMVMKIPDAITAAVDKLSNLFDEYVISPVTDAFSNIKNFFGGIMNNIKGFFDTFGIPEFGFTIPVINKKISIGPFYPFRNQTMAERSLGSGSSSSSPQSKVVKTEDLGGGRRKTIRQDGSYEMIDASGVTKYDKEGKMISKSSPSFSGYNEETFADGSKKKLFVQGPMIAESALDKSGKVVSDRAQYELGPTILSTSKVYRQEPQLGNIINNASISNITAAQSQAVQPVIISAPTNVSNSSSQTIAVSKPARNMDTSFNAYAWRSKQAHSW